MASHRPSPSQGLSPVCDCSLSPGPSLAIKTTHCKDMVNSAQPVPSVPFELSGGSQDAMWIQVTFTESSMGEGAIHVLRKSPRLATGFPWPSYTKCSAETLSRGLCVLLSSISHSLHMAPGPLHPLISCQTLPPLSLSCCGSFCLIVLLLSTFLPLLPEASMPGVSFHLSLLWSSLPLLGCIT